MDFFVFKENGKNLLIKFEKEFIFEKSYISDVINFIYNFRFIM